MTQEKFAHLYQVLTDKYPGYGFQYDGKDTISVPVCIFLCYGIWIRVLNDEPLSTYIELKDANGSLWERQLNDIVSQWRSVEELIAEEVKSLE